MHAPEMIARQLAAHWTCGRWEVSDLTRRGARVLGRDYRWLRPLAERLTEVFPSHRRPGHRQVAGFLIADAGFQRACRQHTFRWRLDSDDPPEMFPTSGGPRTWQVPDIGTVGGLADWLGVTTSHLDWFADRRGDQRRRAPGRLSHYRYHWLAKRTGGSARLIEAPKWRLRTIQQMILHGILDLIPPHEAAHGFCRHRSIRSFAAPHLGQAVVVRTDLRDFFPSVRRTRVRGLFETAGYPAEVAALLAALCTNRIPADVWHGFPQFGSPADRWYHERLYEQPHLPQGVPTSPALANLVAYRLDCRLQGLAAAAGARYTRYADDLLFSGGSEFAARVRRFLPHVGSVVMDEGFATNVRKTRIMRQAGRQCAAGLTINQHANVPRDEYDRLKATLYNCVRRGPASQNMAGVPEFRLHLAGRVAYVESVNPLRGTRLRALFRQITWPDV